jgi:hypothetical protein
MVKAKFRSPRYSALSQVVGPRRGLCPLMVTHTSESHTFLRLRRMEQVWLGQAKTGGRAR